MKTNVVELFKEGALLDIKIRENIKAYNVLFDFFIEKVSNDYLPRFDEVFNLLQKYYTEMLEELNTYMNVYMEIQEEADKYEVVLPTQLTTIKHNIRKYNDEIKLIEEKDKQSRNAILEMARRRIHEKDNDKTEYYVQEEELR